MSRTSGASQRIEFLNSFLLLSLLQVFSHPTFHLVQSGIWRRILENAPVRVGFRCDVMPPSQALDIFLTYARDKKLLEHPLGQQATSREYEVQRHALFPEDDPVPIVFIDGPRFIETTPLCAMAQACHALISNAPDANGCSSHFRITLGQELKTHRFGAGPWMQYPAHPGLHLCMRGACMYVCVAAHAAPHGC